MTSNNENDIFSVCFSNERGNNKLCTQRHILPGNEHEIRGELLPVLLRILLFFLLLSRFMILFALFHTIHSLWREFNELGRYMCTITTKQYAIEKY